MNYHCKLYNILKLFTQLYITLTVWIILHLISKRIQWIRDFRQIALRFINFMYKMYSCIIIFKCIYAIQFIYKCDKYYIETF